MSIKKPEVRFAMSAQGAHLHDAERDRRRADGRADGRQDVCGVAVTPVVQDEAQNPHIALLWPRKRV